LVGGGGGGGGGFFVFVLGGGGGGGEGPGNEEIVQNRTAVQDSQCTIKLNEITWNLVQRTRVHA